LRPVGLAGLAAGAPAAARLAGAGRRGWPGWAARRLRKRRRIGAPELELAFPELDAQAQERLLARNLRATVMGALEMLRAWYAPARALRGLYEVEGLEPLRATLASGQACCWWTATTPRSRSAIASSRRARRTGAPGPAQQLGLPEANWRARAQPRVGADAGEEGSCAGLLRALRAGELVAHRRPPGLQPTATPLCPSSACRAATLVGYDPALCRARAPAAGVRAVVAPACRTGATR
jgi:KDO2-lipid IV(A) lauroyltransferase